MYYLANPSKAALKQKKKREAKKAKKEQDGSTGGGAASGGSIVTNGDSTSALKLHPALADAELTGDPEKVKKIKKLKSVSYHVFFVNRVLFFRNDERKTPEEVTLPF